MVHDDEDVGLNDQEYADGVSGVCQRHDLEEQIHLHSSCEDAPLVEDLKPQHVLVTPLLLHVQEPEHEDGREEVDGDLAEGMLCHCDQNQSQNKPTSQEH